MSKYKVACPNCGCWHNASNGPFAKRSITCQCGNRFSVKGAALTVCACQNCGNKVMLDRARGEKARCPICDAPLFNATSLNRYIDIRCKSCGMPMHVLKDGGIVVCPICEAENDVGLITRLRQIGAEAKPVVLKDSGENSRVIWKHPIHNFVTGSELQVHEGQQAIFFRNGEMMKAFTPGVYKLTTDILPKLTETDPDALIQKPFSAEVYFVNTTVFSDIPWGTASKLNLFDPQSGINVELGASGMLSVRVVDPVRLIKHIVGTRESLTIEDLFSPVQRLGSYRALVITKVKSYLATFIRNNRVNVLEIDAFIDPLSEALRNYINQDAEMQACGLELTSFKLMTLLLPDREENPAFWQMRELLDKRTITEKEAEIARIEAAIREKPSPTPAPVEAVDAMDTLAAKDEAKEDSACPACGNIVSAGSRFCNLCGLYLSEDRRICIRCGKPMPPESAFCSQCGLKLSEADATETI